MPLNTPHRPYYHFTSLTLRLLLLLMIVPLLLGCWPLSDDNQPAGQVLNLSGGSTDPTTLDPALASDSRSFFVIQQLFSGLVRLDNKLQVVPELAEALPTISADGLTYTFKLRSGLTWSDGAPLTSADVVFSLERATDPALDSVGGGSNLPAALYLSDIAGASEKLAGAAATLSGVSAPDAATVVIRLIAPRSYFLQKLTVGPGLVVQRSNVESGANWWRNPLGSGPFKLAQWQSGKLMKLVPNDRYQAGAPKLAAVNISLGADGLGGLVSYEEGKLDVVGVPTVDLERVRDPNGPLHNDLHVVSDLSTTYLGFDQTHPPFDDPKVRQAFSLAIDRDKVARVRYQSQVEAAAGVIPPALAGAKAPALAVDIARAKALLAESRYGAPGAWPRTVLYVPGGDLGTMLQSVLRENLGVEIEVRSLEWSDFLAGLDRHDYPAFVLSWSADWPDASSFMDALFRSNGPENQFSYSDAAVDTALDAAANEPDQQKRAVLYSQIEQQVLAGVPMAPLFHTVSYTLVRSSVHGLEITPLGILSLQNVTIGEGQ